ncbi:hypothetical protein Ancab_004272 [Ancistrocladus abbreviatus]
MRLCMTMMAVHLPGVMIARVGVCWREASNFSTLGKAGPLKDQKEAIASDVWIPDFRKLDREQQDGHLSGVRWAEVNDNSEENKDGFFIANDGQNGENLEAILHKRLWKLLLLILGPPNSGKMARCTLSGMTETFQMLGTLLMLRQFSDKRFWKIGGSLGVVEVNSNIPGGMRATDGEIARHGVERLTSSEPSTKNHSSDVESSNDKNNEGDDGSKLQHKTVSVIGVAEANSSLF